jgi:hypothetical protein
MRSSSGITKPPPPDITRFFLTGYDTGAILRHLFPETKEAKDNDEY